MSRDVGSSHAINLKIPGLHTSTTAYQLLECIQNGEMASGCQKLLGQDSSENPLYEHFQIRTHTTNPTHLDDEAQCFTEDDLAAIDLQEIEGSGPIGSSPPKHEMFAGLDVTPTTFLTSELMQNSAFKDVADKHFGGDVHPGQGSQIHSSTGNHRLDLEDLSVDEDQLMAMAVVCEDGAAAEVHVDESFADEELDAFAFDF